MRLEAIAALLGHNKMEMTLSCARIANRVVAGEYAAASANRRPLRSTARTARRPRNHRQGPAAPQTQARMLGNGLYTPPAELDCRMESACETCAYFRTSVQVPAHPHPATRPRPAAPTGSPGCAVRKPHPAPRSAQRTELIAAPDIYLDHGDAIEPAELLTFIADWLSGGQKPTLDHNLATFAGHTASTTHQLRADLHRFVFLLDNSNSEQQFTEPQP